MIGAHNRRIEIWKRVGAVDAANEPLPDAWALHRCKWAHVKGVTGMASIRDGVNSPLDRYSFRVNYDLTIEVTMRIRDTQGMRYNIVGVRHDLAGRDWTDIVAEIGGSNG